MSRTIDLSDPKSLSLEDRRYLAERSQLPKGAEPVALHPDFTPLGEQLNTGTANTFGLTAIQLQESLERLAELEAKEAERNLEKDLEELERQKSGTTAFDAEQARAEDSSDDEQTYKPSDGWTDEKLSQELEKRGLNAEGNTKAMRARLIKSDRS